MNRTLLLLLLSFWVSTGTGAQTHFRPVASTGLPYTIVILNITVNGNPVAANTEIAVFDDTVCAGAAVYTGSYSVVVTGWQGNPSMNLPGFISGKPIKIKLYTQIQNSWKEITASGLYETGNGLFGNGAFSAVRISSTVSGVKEQWSTAGTLEMRQYPNPFNGSAQFMVDVPETGNYEITLSAMDGKELYSENRLFTAGSKTQFRWTGTPYRTLTSSCYIITISGCGRSYSMKSMHIK
jgi:hypothetical protein